jgi:hypothetical protein
MFFVLSVHIFAYLGSRGEHFFWNSKFILLCLPIVDSTNSYILICIIQIYIQEFIC